MTGLPEEVEKFNEFLGRLPHKVDITSLLFFFFFIDLEPRDE